MEILGVAAANAVDACPPLLGHHHPHAGSTFSDGPCAAAPHAPRSLFTTLLVEEAVTTAWHLCQEDGAPHSDDLGLNAVDLPSFFPISPSKAAHRHSGHAGSVTSASGEGEVPWPSFIDRGRTLGWEVFASEAPSAELGPSSPAAAAAAVINGAAELPGGGRFGSILSGTGGGSFVSGGLSGRLNGADGSIVSGIPSGAGGCIASRSSSGGETRTQRKGASQERGGDGDVDVEEGAQLKDGSMEGTTMVAAAAGARQGRARR